MRDGPPLHRDRSGSGYSVIGLDLSRQMLARAAAAVKAAGVSIEWVHAEAARFSPPERYDGAICF